MHLKELVLEKITIEEILMPLFMKGSVKMDRIYLAIETSCDETAVAIIKNGNEILTNQVVSQIDIHKVFGGVVPEIASRHHVEAITAVVDSALVDAEIDMEEIDAICVTKGPGLIGSLLVGIQAAKTLALVYDKPFIGVHHIAGHIYANKFVEDLNFPLLALVVSGGHTELILMKEDYDFTQIGSTQDDAVGEAYDKVARVLGLPYPGGPHIDRLAHTGIDTFKFPRPMINEDNYNFSFSGLKSAVINSTHNMKQRGEEIIPEDLATSFQTSVVDVLVTKTKRAALEFGVKQVIVAGGVAANRGLRAGLTEAMNEVEIPVLFPPMKLCTDNAAMIGAAADYLYINKKFDGLDLNGVPSLKL
jgi:N6-L-threonylcarbamoyladenine synthase